MHDVPVYFPVDIQLHSLLKVGCEKVPYGSVVLRMWVILAATQTCDVMRLCYRAIANIMKVMQNY